MEEAIRTGDKPKSTKKKIIWQFVFLAVNVAVVIIIATVDFGGGTATVPFSQASKLLGQNWYFLVVAVALVVFTIGLDTLKYTIMIRSATKRTNPRTAYSCSQLGRYYDNVTPLGSGGQPFQIHYLTTQKIDSGKAMGIVLTTYILQQFAFALAAPYFIIRYSISPFAETLFIVLGWVGYTFFISIPLLVVLVTVKPSIAGGIADFFIKLLTKMRILKRPEKLSERMHGALDRFQQTSAYLTKNILRVAVIFIISLVQFAIYFAIPYFVCRALGAPAAGTLDLITRMVMVYFAVTFIPTPGNSVAVEFSFLAVFASVLQGYVFWGILFWRILEFYLYLAQGLIIIIVRMIKNARRHAAGQKPLAAPTPALEHSGGTGH